MRRFMGQPRIRVWLAVVGTATIVLGTAYTLVQQSTRLAADDLPLAAAQTVKQQIESGTEAKDAISAIKTNLSSDSGVFVTVTDNAEHVIATSATLGGQPSLPPAGTFAYTKAHGSDHFTWQPQPGVRLATYIITYGNSPDDGFIVAGQSLKQAEDRINTYGELALAGWLAMIAWSSLILLWPLTSRKDPK